MSSDDQDAPAWGGAIQSAINEAGDEEDEEPVNVVSGSGLSDDDDSDEDSDELPYVVLLRVAVAAVKSGDMSHDEFVEGVRKLDVIADNALKVYDIPAVKKDLPGKLTDYQNEIVGALEVQLHRLKEGLALLLGYPASQALGDLEQGLQLAVDAMHASADIQKKADEERAAILEEEKEEKARRARKAAAADDE